METCRYKFALNESVILQCSTVDLNTNKMIACKEFLILSVLRYLQCSIEHLSNFDNMTLNIIYRQYYAA